MAQWGATDNAANSVNYAIRQLKAGSGKADTAANNTALYGNVTPDSFQDKVARGQFGVSTAEMANTGGEAGRLTHAGWQLRTAGQGPIIATSIVNTGLTFANGETISVSDAGSSIGILTLSTNATGGITSATITTPGSFTNVAGLSYVFTRQKHLNNITIVAGGTSYTNGDIATASNGTSNGTGTLTTNSTGGITAIALTNVGLWANNKTNTHAVVAVTNSTGGATLGSTATLTSNLTTSTTGNVQVTALGGRAGRVHYETLVAMGSMSNGASDDTQLPQ